MPILNTCLRQLECDSCNGPFVPALLASPPLPSLLCGPGVHRLNSHLSSLALFDPEPRHGRNFFPHAANKIEAFASGMRAPPSLHQIPTHTSCPVASLPEYWPCSCIAERFQGRPDHVSKSGVHCLPSQPSNGPCSIPSGLLSVFPVLLPLDGAAVST
jgi:hypothetical protein